MKKLLTVLFACAAGFVAFPIVSNPVVANPVVGSPAVVSGGVLPRVGHSRFKLWATVAGLSVVIGLIACKNGVAQTA